MDDTVAYLIQLKRHLNSIEHMIYVSCKFTRTTEMLRKVMETIVQGYEEFFAAAYTIMITDEVEDGRQIYGIHDKIELLRDTLEKQGIEVDMSDYFLLKKLLMSDFDSIGEYRKNLCMVTYIDGEEYVINMSRLLEFYNSLRDACSSLNQVVA